MRLLIYCLLCCTSSLAACGGSQSSQASQLVFGGSGTIIQQGFDASGAITGSATLSNGVAPGGMTFLLSAGGRTASGSLAALAETWDGRDLRMLDGSELSVDQVFTGEGTLVVDSSTSSLALTFDYTVEAYMPPEEPILTLAIDANTNGANITGTLTASIQ